jgi:hypothetical protein
MGNVYRLDITRPVLGDSLLCGGGLRFFFHGVNEASEFY